MIKIALMVAVALVFANSGLIEPASAKQEVQTTRIVYELSDFPDLAAKTAKVCADEKLIKSARLATACKEQKFPRVTKAGNFYNTGYGAELNALIRQQ